MAGTPLAEAFIRIRPESTQFKSEAERVVGGAGNVAGQKFGTEFSRDASGKLRDEHSKFVGELGKTGSDSGTRFGNEFSREAEAKSDGAGKHIGSKMSEGIGGALRSLGGLMAGLFAVDQIGEFLAKSREMGEESEKLDRMTAAVITSTGGAANVSAEGVGKLATSISNLTGIDDEAIKGAENLMLTFTNVRNGVGKGNDIFDQSTLAVTNMSAALGQDMKSSTIQLGKALNDPIKGISALSRVGVSFTEQQKQQISTMVKSGDTMGAQKVILKELNTEFGGAAAAATDPAQKAKVAWENLQEQLGRGMLPMVDKVAEVLSGTVIPAVSGFLDQVTTGEGPIGAFSKGMEKAGEAGNALVSMFKGGEVTNEIGKALGTDENNSTLNFLLAAKDGVGNFAKDLVANSGPSILRFGDSVKELGPKILDLGAQVGMALLPTFQDIGKLLSDTVIPTFLDLETAYVKNLGPALDHFSYWFSTEFAPALQGAVGELTSFVRVVISIAQQFVAGMMQRLAPMMPAVRAIFTTIGDIVKLVMELIGAVIHSVLARVQEFWAQWGQQIMNVVSVIFTTIINILGPLLDAIKNVIKVVIDAIHGDWGAVWQDIKKIGEDLWKAIVATIQGAVNILRSIFDAFWPTIKKMAGEAWDWIKKTTTDAWNGVTKAVSDGVNGAVDFVKGLPRKITDGIGDMGSLLLHKGEDLINGLIQGIRGMGGTLTSFITGWIKANVPAPVAAALGINSPSTVMRDLGKWVAPGLANGLDEGTPALKKSMDKVMSVFDVKPSLDFGATSVSALSQKLASTSQNQASPSLTLDGPVDLGPDTIAALGSQFVDGSQGSLVMDKWGANMQRTTRGRSW